MKLPQKISRLSIILNYFPEENNLKKVVLRFVNFLTTPLKSSIVSEQYLVLTTNNT